MDAQEIIRLLEEPTNDRRPIKHKILDEAPIEELITAMHESKTVLTYKILCEILGKRKATQAVPSLIEALHNTNDGVRSEAAEALAHIESIEAGEDLLNQYLQEASEDTKEWEVIALGAVGYRPAIPHLIQALQVNRLRRYAALALGELKAQEAREAIQQAMDQEKDTYTITLMKQALKDLDA